jgi:NAD(P)-dependent dehydrogenase (short-subunit alcohol dehydrogenase family)
MPVENGHALALSTHALIIGGTRGIGRSLVERFLKDGRMVSVVARKPPLDQSKIDHKLVRYWQADIAQRGQLDPVLAEIVRERGKLQSMVFLQRYRGEGDDWEGELAVSVTATKNIIDFLAGDFDEQGGAIAVVNSNASEVIVDEQPLGYHAAKAALLQLVRFYAVNLGPRNIRVNGICPITTVKLESRDYYLNNSELMKRCKKMIPLGRLGTAEEVANVIAFLCSEQASFITGQNLTVDGGISLRGHEALARILKS